ncbi:MDR family MFS transporter [Chitinophaga sancti]|uniref:MDR family MFS transporter n=1 Tax=Chitinophaga sancti TaxID=1004 RepID=UPI002A7525DE|nr:MDR family MFS transporter [Chitinophaga sancti]WPQ60633.1 MDR family MFS transporter [Chitinophaga sancti]
MKQRFGILFPLILGTFMAGIDSSIVNVSLPTMSTQFGVGLDAIEWVIVAYMLGFCVFMPLTSWLKEQIGFYALYLISLSIFTFGSLLCAISNSLPELIAARAIQSFGGGAITPTAMAILTLVFPAEERGKVMGWWSLGSIAGPAIGPTLGGTLTNLYGWPSIFYINLPIGILTIGIAAYSLRFLKTNVRQPARFDASGFGVFTVFIVLFQYAIAVLPDKGFTSLGVWIPFIVSIIAIVVFIRRSLPNPQALFNLHIFRHRIYTYCILITSVRSVAIYGGLFLMPFLFQGQLGFSEIASGLLILPFSAVMALVTPIAGSLYDKTGPRRLIVTGLLLVAISMIQLSQLNTPALFPIIAAMVVRGLGIGLLVSTITSAAMSAVLPEEVTQASSMFSLLQQLSGTIGIAFSGLLQQYIMRYYTDGKGYTEVVAHHYGIQDTFFIAAVLVVVTVPIAMKLPHFVKRPVK